jgi:hypothetical protein
MASFNLFAASSFAVMLCGSKLNPVTTKLLVNLNGARFVCPEKGYISPTHLPARTYDVRQPGLTAFPCAL